MQPFNFRPSHLKLLKIFNLLSGILLLVFILLFARHIISSQFGKKEKFNTPQTSNPQIQNKTSFQEYAVILRNNPFGFPGGTLRQLSEAPGRSVASSDVILIGAIAGSEKNSYAIFSDKSGKQEVFKAGAAVFDLGTLKKVDKDRVFIQAKGVEKLMELQLSDFITIKDISKDISASQAGVQTSGFVKSLGDKSFIVDQKKIQDALANPNQIMTDARLQPHFVNGKQEGFLMKEVKNNGIYQNLGLQNGDVLLKINDYTLSSPESGMQAFNALRGMDRVQLDILRGGEKTTLTYQIK